MLHCSQCNSHSFVDCFEHFGVDPLHSNCTTLCSLDKSKSGHPHKLCTDVRVKCHSTNGCQGSHIDDTFKHLVGCTRGRWSYKNLIKYCHPSKENPPKNTHLFIQNVLFNRLIKNFWFMLIFCIKSSTCISWRYAVYELIKKNVNCYLLIRIKHTFKPTYHLTYI